MAYITKLTPKILFDRLVTVGREIAKEENLPLKTIIRNAGGALGRCHWDGTVEITVRVYALESVMIEEAGRTLAHELAHLKHMNHDAEFWNYAAELCSKVGSKMNARVRPESVMMKGVKPHGQIPNGNQVS